MDRRRFLQTCAAAGAATLATAEEPKSPTSASNLPLNGMAVPDKGWTLWLDTKAEWRDDIIYLPADVELRKLPSNAPTDGWDVLYARTSGKSCTQLTLPATVEQYFWGKNGSRPYTPEEYRYAAEDTVPQNGAYEGVSWWWRPLDIPAAMQGKRILLHVRAARMRAEVYLNGKLVGYSIMEELPFTCDLTAAARPGEANKLAIRITNPGGRYDWVDGTTITWGKLNLYRSHGFGGFDRGITLEGVPLSGHISDAWVLNTPEPRTITAFAQLEGELAGTPAFEVLDPATGKVIASAAGESDKPNIATAKLTCPDAKLWDLDKPALYHLRVTSGGHTRIVSFGFRWFAPVGLGKDAMFRLNGRRIKLYTSISWGFWGHNGLFPTPELAEREVTQAKRLGLNCLNFHRNVGKHDVMDAHDRRGLLRYMEPGGGKLSIGKLPSGVASNAAGTVMEKPKSEADLFSQRFMLEKCRAMVRAFRSHPSLIQYTLQNEIGADLKNPDTFTAIDIMHAEDPSRCVVLNDGFVGPPRNAAQAWYEPYNDNMHRSDKEAWGAWWNNHQGAGDQWYDEFYKDAEHFTYNQPLETALVEFGEMEGCAVADNHSLIVHQIETKAFGGSGTSYDLADHRIILANTTRWLDHWGFRKAFPTTDALYRSLGNKCYESWQQYMENVRICDDVDFCAISGWESTAIENHSGIVDNLRNFKGDPELIASSLRPVRLVAKQHKLVCALGEAATFDLYLLNDTSCAVSGKLRFSMIEPNGHILPIGSYDAPLYQSDVFSYTVAKAISTPALEHEGIYKLRFTSDTAPSANFTREIWVANAKPAMWRPLRIAVSSLLPTVHKQLSGLGIEITNFQPGERYDLILTSGVVKGSNLDRQIGEETGLEAQPAKSDKPAPQSSGRIDAAVLDAVQAGTPLLAIVPDDFLADGVAKQLAALGAFTYAGQVGNTRAPWMGNWLFVRDHSTFAHMPTDRVLSVHYQAHGKQSNGLRIDSAVDAPAPEIIMGYSRDHDRECGAASFTCRLGKASVLVHRAPEFSAPLQARWLANAINHLTSTAV